MNRFDKYLGSGIKYATTPSSESDDVTRQGLAYTPADMEKMLSQGLPVSSKELASRFYDGDDKSDFFVSSDRVRNNDVNDLWEESQDIRARARAAYKESRKHVKPKAE